MLLSCNILKEQQQTTDVNLTHQLFTFTVLTEILSQFSFIVLFPRMSHVRTLVVAEFHDVQIEFSPPSFACHYANNISLPCHPL